MSVVVISLAVLPLGWGLARQLARHRVRAACRVFFQLVGNLLVLAPRPDRPQMNDRSG